MIPCTLSLPWPPSENSYRRAIIMGKSARMLISKKGREYKQDVCAALTPQLAGQLPALHDLKMLVVLYPPNRRKIDLDNRLKALQDALEEAKVFEDDSQIKSLNVELGEIVKGGRALVHLSPWTEDRQTFPERLIGRELAEVVA